MAARNPDWYAANATRAYPLDDAATARDDAGRELPPQILVDCRVRFPLALGRFAYLGGLTVGPYIVTATLLAAPDAARAPGGVPPGDAGFRPLGAVTLPRPVYAYRHYPIQPLAAGVGGWLVFGRGIDEPYTGRFTQPIQSMLLPRVAAAYHPLPVHSLGKLGVAQALTGVVRLVGGSDLEVIRAEREIDGAIVDAIVIRLVDALNRNVLDLYKGPCGGRPESRTCGRPGLEKLNTVEPDCTGDLTIEFRGAHTAPFAGGGGIALDLPLGLAEVCTDTDRLPDSTGRLPDEYDDECASEISEPSEESSELPEESSEVPPEESSELPCIGLPYYAHFDDCDTTGWVVVIGGFGCEADDSPGEPFGLEATEEGGGLEPGHIPGFTAIPPLHRAASTRASGGGIAGSYAALDPSRRNAAVWDDCGYDNSLGLVCVTHLRLMPGVQINGGIIVNYHLAGAPARPHYHLVLVNAITNALEVHYYNGSLITRIHMVKMGVGNARVRGDDWYELRVATRPSIDDNAIIDIQLRGVTNPGFPQTTVALVAPQYGNPDGKFGLGSINAHCRFSFFQLEMTA